LLHGSQPDVFVVCHEPGRTHVLGHSHFELPSIEEVVDLTLRRIDGAAMGAASWLTTLQENA
jgi:uncharacterized NAD-dependent epimerase/dehydratase family protein